MITYGNNYLEENVITRACVSKLTVLKLGGAVVTVKNKDFTVNKKAIIRLAEEIARSNVKSLIIVHGGLEEDLRYGIEDLHLCLQRRDPHPEYGEHVGKEHQGYHEEDNDSSHYLQALSFFSASDCLCQCCPPVAIAVEP